MSYPESSTPKKRKEVDCEEEDTNNNITPKNDKLHSQPLNSRVFNDNQSSQSTTTITSSPKEDQKEESKWLNQGQLRTSFDKNWVVRFATNFHINSDEDYKMTSAQRGICLIINNYNFELDVLPTRKGSDMDAFRFKKIFSQLGFIVDCKRNVTADKMKSLFKLTALRCPKRYEALVVIILSHGTESGIYGVDGLEVDLNDVIINFDNKHCRNMIGKPKVFIIQACRGRLSDYGVKDTQTNPSQQDTQSAGFTQPSQLSQSYPQSRIGRWSEFDRKCHPTRTDMLLCFSCQSGYVSTRNEEEGSWLGDSLAKYIQQEAHRLHLIEILNMVSREVRKRKSSEGHKQVLEITSIGFDRNLYFNPGLYLPE